MTSDNSQGTTTLQLALAWGVLQTLTNAMKLFQ